MLAKHISKFKIPLLSKFTKRYFASGSKVYPDCTSAITASGLKSGDTLIVGGFGLAGHPVGLLHDLSELKDINNLTVVSNNCGIDDWGLGKVLNNNQIKRMCSSFAGLNKTFGTKYINGQLEVEWIPQGTLSERMRAGGAGIPIFYTRTGRGTWMTEGKMPLKYCEDGSGNVELFAPPKQVQELNGEVFLLEPAIRGDVAFISAYQVDLFGNCRFRGSAKNFNPEAATSARFTIVEAEEIVPLGVLEPEHIQMSGIYVNGIVKSHVEHKFEKLMFSTGNSDEGPSIDINKITNEDERKRCIIASRAAKEINDGMCVNLGVGIPTLIPNFVDRDIDIWLESENGILGVGRYPHEGEQDPWLINAGHESVTLQIGASVFSSNESFQMIRGGHIDATFLGSMEVSKHGNIANWMVPGKKVTGMGGAMDLVNSSSKKVICMQHTNKNGKPKIVDECALPLTGVNCVNKIITELCVIDVLPNNQGLSVVELINGTTVEEVIQKTGCELKFDQLNK